MSMKSLYIVTALALCVASCTSKTDEKNVVAFTGATIIDESNESPIRDGIILVEEGKIIAIGTKEQVQIPAGAEVKKLTGKFITPGFINAHGHVGDVKGIEGGHYSRENIIDNLHLYAHYGVTTVVSLGGDRAEAVDLRAVTDTTAIGRARLYIAGAVVTGTTAEEALKMVDSNHEMGVDFMKIRVDDNLGTAISMPSEVYKPVIDRSHKLGYKIATHMYYLDDAKQLLRSGSDLMAHSVRDKDIDTEFIELMKEKKVCYCPTLTREVSTFVYGDTARFFSDPFFNRMNDTALIRPLLDPERQKQIKNSKSAITYRQQLPTAMANLKRLADNGIPIAFGTDSGIPTRFMGYFEHMEMDMMQEAGLTPSQILRSATIDAARCMGLKGVGTLVPGNWADFVVLDKNPLDDIRNIHQLDAVYVGGQRVN
jgi:imidazolonepropionase-like amidohydrolase